MSHITPIARLLLPGALLGLLTACGSALDPVVAAAPSPQELAARVVAVDSGLLAELDEPLDAEPLVEAEPTPEPAPLVTSWTVRRGETLAHFARWAELPVETVAEASGLSLADSLDVGDTVVVPGDGDVRSKVEEARQRHHRRRAEAYLASRGGSVGTSFHTVRTGETGWSVATRELGVPVWLLEAYNPAVDLERLRPGEQLLYPVVADTVAALDAESEATPASSEAP